MIVSYNVLHVLTQQLILCAAVTLQLHLHL